MARNQEYSLEEVQEIAKSLIGHRFGDYSEMYEEEYDKGTFGHILEDNVFEYDINSKPEPDFENIGVELKCTPYKINNNGTLSAKERLVINVINYCEEVKNDFFHSHFWEKAQVIQLVWYLYEDGVKKSDFIITHELLFRIPDYDLLTFISDYNIIMDKIKAGKAHEISESDTMYLGACTKGENSSVMRVQPYSNILAKQRAFCFKKSYMSIVVRNVIGNSEDVERILKNKNKSLQDLIYSSFEFYKGLSVEELKNHFEITTNPKNINYILTSKMLGLKNDDVKAEEFEKANIEVKTIRITETNKIAESMSFPTFKFKEIVEEDFEDSYIYNKFNETKFLFVVFREKEGQYYFDGVKLWNMPFNVLNEEVRKVYLKTQEVIRNGDIVKSVSKKGVRKTNFPGMTSNPYCHVRPHAQNSMDTYDLPVKDKVTGANKYTKQCFWLNNSYILSIINENESK